MPRSAAGRWIPPSWDDRHIVRRMVLKRCVYGVDKNLMAVELAKVSLWLHTFTVGAPLSFLDHHLRHGDSLFGSWVRGGIDRAASWGKPLLLHEPMHRAMRAAAAMQVIEGLTDAEIAEAERSELIFEEVREMTAPLDAFLSFIHAIDWLDPKAREDKAALHAFFDGQFGDPVRIALGSEPVMNGRAEAVRFSELLAKSRELIEEEHFLSWQVAFPGVWSIWESAKLTGGFDAIIGNPPWDRMKLQQVEWFAARRRDIALAQRAPDRTRLPANMQATGDPLARDHAKAEARAEAAFRMARGSGDYPLLSGGDMNIYSLFVERAMALVKPDGIVGLLTPSGIASDKTAAPFFKGISTGGRLKALYDFENRRTRYGEQPFFPDVDSRFKFCAFVASPSPFDSAARCAFFLQDVSELQDPERRFPLSPSDFARVNPNTGTAPVFRTRRDAALTTAIYGRLSVLVDRSAGGEVKTWPGRYATMFHMANDSGLFRTHQELEEREGAYPIGGNRFRSGAGDWVPLYEGKMVQAFDHRAADIVTRENNLFRPGQQTSTASNQKTNPERLPIPRYFVRFSNDWWKNDADEWVIGFKDITAATNVRTMIAAILPLCGAGHTLPVLNMEVKNDRAPDDAALITGNLNSVILDYIARQKVQTTHFLRIPVVTLHRYEPVRFGKKTAAKIVRQAVLELTYTAHDMAPFARDMGYVDKKGQVKPPFVWDEDRR